MDAPALLLDLHGKLLRAAAAHQGQHFAGLAVAGRHLHRKGIITVNMKNKFIRLDFVCAYLRHVNAPQTAQFLAVFEAALGVGQNSALTEPGSSPGSTIVPGALPSQDPGCVHVNPAEAKAKVVVTIEEPIIFTAAPGVTVEQAFTWDPAAPEFVPQLHPAP